MKLTYSTNREGTLFGMTFQYPHESSRSSVQWGTLWFICAVPENILHALSYYPLLVATTSTLQTKLQLSVHSSLKKRNKLQQVQYNVCDAERKLQPLRKSAWILPHLLLSHQRYLTDCFTNSIPAITFRSDRKNLLSPRASASEVTSIQIVISIKALTILFIPDELLSPA